MKLEIHMGYIWELKSNDKEKDRPWSPSLLKFALGFEPKFSLEINCFLLTA